MLVLSRKAGERILIGDGIEITVVRISPNSVRIGVDAPKDCRVVRTDAKLQDEAPHPADAPNHDLAGR